MAFKRYGKKRFHLRKRGGTSRVKKATKRAVKRTVKRVVRNMAESKQVCLPFSMFPLSLRDTSQALTDNVIALGPTSSTQQSLQVSQGTSNSTRIGNRVTTRKVLLKYQMTPAPYDATFNYTPRPVFVRLWFVKSKINSTSNLLPSQIVGAPPAPARLFEQSNTTTGLQGTLGDLQRKVSSDSFTYMGVRTFKLGFSNYGGTEGASSASLVAANQMFANNDFKLSYFGTIDCTKWHSKTVKWNDAGEVTTSWLFCIVQVLAADGATLGLSDRLVNMKFEHQFVYSDM